MRKVAFSFLLVLPMVCTWAQVSSVTIGGTGTNPKAVLWLVPGSGGQGLLLPVVSTTVRATSNMGLTSSDKGMVVYDQTDNNVYYWDGTSWKSFGAGSITLVGDVTGQADATVVGRIQGRTVSSVAPTDKQALIFNNGAGRWEPITLGGDVSAGTISGTTMPFSVAALRGVTISATPPSLNQVLQYNGAQWAPATPAAAVATNLDGITDVTVTSATSGQILVKGTGATDWANQTMGGDVSINSSGNTTIQPNTIGSTEISNGTITGSDLAGTIAITTTGNLTVNSPGAITAAGVNASGTITLGSLSGAGSRMVVANATGVLSTQAIPSTFTTLNVIPKGNGSTLVASQIFDDGTNVGIGTTTPGSTLEIQALSPGLNLTSTSGVSTSAASSLSFYNALSGLVGTISDPGSSDNLQISATNALNVNTSFTTRLSIYSNGNAEFMGNVGIGIAPTSFQLDVQDIADNQIRTFNPNSSSGTKSGIRFGTGSSWAVQLQTDQDGNWLELTNNSNQAVHTWAYNYYAPTNTFGATDLGLPGSRWQNIYLVNVPNISSDKRLKNNIQDLHYGLGEVLKLRPVSYSLLSDKENEVKLGLVAQEVKEIIPEIVTEDKSKEKLMGLGYTELIPVLIKAIQDQQKIIDDLVKKNKISDSSLMKLRAEVDELKRMLGAAAKKGKD